MPNQELGKELHKPIIRKFEERKIHSSFIKNIWDADFADMQLINRFSKGTRILLCVIDIFSKYAWAAPLEEKEGIAITNAFQKISDESSCKSNIIWEVNFNE